VDGLDPTSVVLLEVAEERARQDDKWGVQDHSPAWWCVIETEELGEVARAIYEGDLRQTREELVQVAAVAVAAIESIDRSQD
jgi:NTP pyrophosphatase (non-canonical NTP hydrolase)